MHTTILDDDGHSRLTMIHNGDFSGDVELIWEGGRMGGGQWTLPGWLVQAIRENAVEGVLDWVREFPLCDVEAG